MEHEFSWKLLLLGAMECDKYRMVRTEDKTERIRIPVEALLIRHPEAGVIVYDTGNAPGWEQELSADTKKNFPIVACRSLAEALAEEGLTPADVDRVILSHLHFDHAGNLRIFAGTSAGERILVGRAEYERAVKAVEEGSTAYVKEHFQVPGLGFELLDGEVTLGEGLKLFFMTSHSPAMACLEIHIPGERPLLVVSDAVYTAENYEKELPPDSPNRANAGGFFENLAWLKARARELSADVLFGHDMAQVEHLPEDKKNGFFLVSADR